MIGFFIFPLKPSPGGIQSVILSSLGNGFGHKMEHTVRIYLFHSIFSVENFSTEISPQNLSFST